MSLILFRVEKKSKIDANFGVSLSAEDTAASCMSFRMVYKAR